MNNNEENRSLSNESSEIFSQRLRELRANENKTQAEFVKNLNITPSALSSYEKNTKNPSINVVREIAIEYKVSIDWLCGLSDEKKLDGEVKTYSDLILLINKIITSNPPSWEISVEKDACTRIICKDRTLCLFCLDMKKMYTLLCEGTIDKHLYNLWLNDKLKSLNNLEISLDPLSEPPFI